MTPTLGELREKPLNFELPLAGGEGWHVDDYRQPLPPGSFEVARRLMTDYAFADPTIVRAIATTWLARAARDTSKHLRDHRKSDTPNASPASIRRPRARIAARSSASARTSRRRVESRTRWMTLARRV